MTASAIPAFIDHLAAHDVLSDLARSIVGIARAHGAAHLGGDESGLDLPVKERFARIIRP